MARRTDARARHVADRARERRRPASRRARLEGGATLRRVSDERIRILRLIARLNVGGPSLHVSYLASDLAALGYDTILAAGRVGSDEGSMEYVARERGVQPL